jgi:hypothetical protein
MKTIAWKNGDIDIHLATGRAQYITGLRKANQDVGHALLTLYNPRRDIGSELLQFEEKVKDSERVPLAQAAYVRRYVTEAIQRLMRHQTRNKDFIPDTEFLATIDHIDVFSGSSPTDVYFYAQLYTVNGDVIESAFEINLKHQLPDSAIPFLPGGADDFGPTT